MSTTRRVLWAEIAVRDLEGIVDHVAADDPGAAAALLDRLEARAAALSTMPERGRVVPELASFDVSAYREVIEKNYRIAFRAGRDDVLVLAVLDGRREPEAVLLSRALKR